MITNGEYTIARISASSSLTQEDVNGESSDEQDHRHPKTVGALWIGITCVRRTDWPLTGR